MKNWQLFLIMWGLTSIAYQVNPQNDQMLAATFVFIIVAAVTFLYDLYDFNKKGQ